MEQRPFQFGLKAIFAAMSGLAMLLAIGTALPPPAFWGLVIAAALWALSLVVGVAFAFMLATASDHSVRLWGILIQWVSRSRSRHQAAKPSRQVSYS